MIIKRDQKGINLKYDFEISAAYQIEDEEDLYCMLNYALYNNDGYQALIKVNGKRRIKRVLKYMKKEGIKNERLERLLNQFLNPY